MTGYKALLAFPDYGELKQRQIYRSTTIPEVILYDKIYYAICSGCATPMLLSWLNLKLGHKENPALRIFIAKSIHSEEFTGSLVFTLGIVSILLLNLQKIYFCGVTQYLYSTGFMVWVWCSYNCQILSDVIIICCCCWNRSTFPHMISILVGSLSSSSSWHVCFSTKEKKSRVCSRLK